MVLVPRSRGRRALLLAVLLFSLLGACHGTDPGEPLIVLGTGERAFEPLEDGQELEMVPGGQGGWHLWVSVRAGGIRSRGVQLECQTWPVERGRPLQTTYRTEDLVSVDGEPLYELVGWPAVLSYPECHVNREVAVAVSLEDARGTILSAERVVVLRPGPDGGPTEPCPPE